MGCSSEGTPNGGDGDGTGGEGQNLGTGGNVGTGGVGTGGALTGTGGLDSPGTGGVGAVGTGGVPGGTGGASAGTGGAPIGTGGEIGTGGATSGTGGTLPQGDTPVERYGQLSVSGAHIVDENSQPVALHGLGFGWDNWWPQFYTADVVSWVASDFCVDVVRPAMGIDPDGGGAYLDNPSASQSRIETVADAAIANGIYVIIDWHSHNLHESDAVTFFSAMAQKYGSSPNVIYEVFNEPDDETWSQVKSYAQNVIAAIRQHDPDNIVIVGNPEWDQRIDQVQADPITTDDNVVYAVHYYADTHGSWLRERTQAAINAGIPVFISESSGSAADGLGANNYTEWEAWFDFLDNNDVGWINYAIADKSGETISILEQGASGSGGWDENSLTESGEYIRTKLRSYCQ